MEMETKVASRREAAASTGVNEPLGWRTRPGRRNACQLRDTFLFSLPLSLLFGRPNDRRVA